MSHITDMSAGDMEKIVENSKKWRERKARAAMTRSQREREDAASALNNAYVPLRPASITCPKHGEYNGWIGVRNGKEFASQCDECALEAEEQERKERATALAEGISSTLELMKQERASIPKRFRGKSFKSFTTPTKRILEVRNQLASFVTTFDKALDEGTSFLFTGGTRRGKTSLACAAANNVMMKGWSASYISSLHLISRVKRAWAPNATESEDEIVELFVGYDLLVIDEIGKGTMTPREVGILFRTMDRRYEECKPTIGISNLSEQKLSDMLGPETISRLKAGGGASIQFDWEPFE